MANVAIGFGIALIALGLISFIGTGSHSPTALIPAFFGLVLVILGLIARDPAKRKQAMHAAAVVGLIGFLGGAVRGFGPFLRMMSGELVERPNAVLAQIVMAALSLAFLMLCVKSFIDARRARTL
jgi:hypothetical protein